MTVNAGAIPAEHWTQGAAGGGRIIGEACHFIDLLRFLAGVPIEAASITHLGAARADTATLQLKFADGSLGTIHYFANGSRAFPKERLEIFARGGVLQLDNFRKLQSFGWPGFKSHALWRQDKGQRDCARAFVAAVHGGPPPIPVAELLEVARVTIELGQ
jgi:predicted dehydrogenase